MNEHCQTVNSVGDHTVVDKSQQEPMWYCQDVRFNEKSFYFIVSQDAGCGFGGGGA